MCCEDDDSSVFDIRNMFPDKPSRHWIHSYASKYEQKVTNKLFAHINLVLTFQVHGGRTCRGLIENDDFDVANGRECHTKTSFHTSAK